MKITLIVLVVLAAITFLFLAKTRPTAIEVSGTVRDIPRYVDALLNSNDPNAFLIIRLEGKDDFIQLSSDGLTLELDFPQVTERQKNLRPRIEKVCLELGLELEVNCGTDGTEFLDYVLSGTPEVISETIENVLMQLFLINETTILNFTGQSLEIVQSAS